MSSQLFFFGKISLVIFLTVLLGYLVNRFFIRLINRASNELNNDPTNYKFLRRAVVTGIYAVGFGIAIYWIPQLRALAGSLLAGAGIIAVAVGFASQHALSNIISGFFIIIFKPFRVHDRLTINQMTGIVEDITLRHVVIRDFQNNRIVIPNSVISQESLINADIIEDKTCRWVDIGISYSSDIDKARAIMKEEIINHPLHIDPRTAEKIAEGEELAPVRVIALAESSVNLRGWAWARNAADGFQMSCDLLEKIKNRFDQEGIVIPFPQRDVHFKKN